MDETSQQLLQELNSIGSKPLGAQSKTGSAAQKLIPAPQEDKHDRWRILLVDLAYLISESLRDIHYWEGVKAEKGTFRQFGKVLDELDQIAVHDELIRINHRGVRSAKTSERADYVIQFGDISVDVSAVASLIDRMGIRLTHLEGRLIKSFETFADQGFSTLQMKLPGQSSEAIAALKISLRVISCFNQAVEKNSPIVLTKTDSSLNLFPTRNEHNQPDLNLTLLAAVNNLNQNAMTKLVEQVSAKIDPAISGRTVFETIFKIKQLRQRLIRPPLEATVETASRSRGQAGQTGMALGGSSEKAAAGVLKELAQLQQDPSALKENVARFVKETFGKSLQTASHIMKSIYGQDYPRINSQGLGHRLKLITALLNSIQKSPAGQNVAAEVLRRIQARMDKVPDEILEDFVVKDQELKYWSAGAETTVGKVDKDLIKIIDQSRRRSGAQKKRKIRLTPEKDYTDMDIEAIAADFGISTQDTAEIIRLFQNCFDTQGNFLRAAFEKNVSKLAAYEKKVFEILWEFLKESPRRSNRLPLLNSLQLLVRETKKPIQAIKLLLAYFIQNPGNVSYADRNAIMLANQFLRSYNKEINMDIEMTPEEVLLVKDGLDTHVVNYVAWKVDAEQKPLLEKMVAVRKILIEAMNPDLSERQPLPIRYLLALEREVHIFLALVGGKTAFEVTRSALNVYGNPASQIYRLKESPNHLEALLLHLAAIIRGFVRQSSQSDFSLLAEVKTRQDQFRKLHEDLHYQALVRHVMDLIEESSAGKGALKSK